MKTVPDQQFLHQADSNNGQPDLLAEHGQGAGESRPETSPLLIELECEEEESCTEELCPAHGPRHGLSVYGVDGEQERGDEAGGGTDVVAAHQVVEEAHQHVQLQVDQVEAQGREAVQQVIQSEGEDAEWSVGFVGLLLVH